LLTINRGTTTYYPEIVIKLSTNGDLLWKKEIVADMPPAVGYTGSALGHNVVSMISPTYMKPFASTK
jgi:hypothetical protein